MSTSVNSHFDRHRDCGLERFVSQASRWQSDAAQCIVRLAEYAARRGVPFVDLTPALRALPADSLELAFISRIESGVAPGVIGHYTPAGGTWVAHQLALSFAAIPSLRGLFVAPRQTGPQRDTQDAAPIPAARPVAHAHKKL